MRISHLVSYLEVDILSISSRITLGVIKAEGWGYWERVDFRRKEREKEVWNLTDPTEWVWCCYLKTTVQNVPQTSTIKPTEQTKMYNVRISLISKQ